MQSERAGLIDALQGQSFFAALSPGWRHTVESSSVRRVLRRGDIVFRETDPPEGLFVLTSGAVEFRRQIFGRTIVVDRQNAPSALLTIALFDGGRNWLSAVAASSAEVYLLDRATFDRMCAARPACALQLVRLCCGRVRKAVSLVDLLSLARVRQRVAKLILEMSEEAGGNVVSLPFSLEQLAVRLGTVREVAYRNLRHLEADGIIRFRRRVVVINDLPRLQAEAVASAMTAPYG